MTDYLEQAVEGNADALLEAQQRLERTLATGAGGNRETETADGANPSAGVEESLRSAAKRAMEGWLREENDPAQALEPSLAVDGWRTPAAWLQDGPRAAAPEGAAEESGKTPLDTAAAEESALPLLKQVVQLQRQSEAGSRIAAGLGETALPGRTASGADRPGGRRSRGRSGSGFALEAEEAAYGSIGRAQGLREQDWAEQVDRAFRRDSRRYDSGFFLY